MRNQFKKKPKDPEANLEYQDITLSNKYKYEKKNTQGAINVSALETLDDEQKMNKKGG